MEAAVPRLRIVSFNINGIRALGKRLDGPSNLLAFFQSTAADIICFQETKISEDQLDDSLLHVPGFESFWSCCAVKKGYSGVATYCKDGLTAHADPKPFGDPQFDGEGRTLMTDHGAFVLFNVYFPNAGRGEDRLRYKLAFYHALQKKLNLLVAGGRKVVVVGDYNTPYENLDIWDPKMHSPALCPEERHWMRSFMDHSGFVDTFRRAHPGEAGHYTWWDPTTGGRMRNEGWRIDYTFVSSNLLSDVLDSAILMKVQGSDHCPVSIDLRAPPPIPPSPTPHPLSSKHLLLKKQRQSITSFFKPSPKQAWPPAAASSSSASPSASASASLSLSSSSTTHPPPSSSSSLDKRAKEDAPAGGEPKKSKTE